MLGHVLCFLIVFVQWACVEKLHWEAIDNWSEAEMVPKVSFLGFCSLRVSCNCIKWPGSVHGTCEQCFTGAQSNSHVVRI